MPSSYWYDPAAGSSYSRGAQIVVIFNQDYLDSIEEATDITVTYEATVNERAVNTYQQTDSSNEAVFAFGHTATVSDYTHLNTLQLVVYKYEGSEASSSSGTKALNGVGFVLAREDGKYFCQDPDTLAVTWVEDIEDAAKLETANTLIWTYVNDNYYGHYAQVPRDGYIVVDGLTGGTYTLIETDPLPGYNPAADITFTLPDPESTGGRWWKKQLNVANKTGTVLPTTGGPGVVFCYLLGACLVLFGAFLLRPGKEA